jgi:hypothetical protein
MKMQQKRHIFDWDGWEMLEKRTIISAVFMCFIFHSTDSENQSTRFFITFSVFLVG